MAPRFRTLAPALVAVALALTLPREAPAQVFTIGVIPDTQNYGDYRYQKSSLPPFGLDYAEQFYAETAYLAGLAAIHGGPIAFAIQLGDLTNHGGREAGEWDIADRAFATLDGVLPYLVVPGNHDYDRVWVDPLDRRTRVDGGTTFTAHFGPQSPHFAGRAWYGGSHNGGLDSYGIFEADGEAILVLGLELEPPPEALAWADGVLREHPGIPVIVATHEYLSARSALTHPTSTARVADVYRKGFPRSTPQEVWDGFLSRHPAIFLVLCGHSYVGSHGEGRRTDLDEAGYPVFQVLADYQGRTEVARRAKVDDGKGRGGDGWIRLLDVDLGAGRIHVRTFSPVLGRSETDADSDFILELGPKWRDRLR